MAVICNTLRQATSLDKYTRVERVSSRYSSRKLVELLIYLSRRFQILKNQLERIPDDTMINMFLPYIRFIHRTSELFSFYLDSIASFLTSDKPSHNVLFV